MIDGPNSADLEAVRRFPFAATAILVVGVYACALYANLSFAVKDRADYRFFPPFQRGVNANWNRDLGAEYFSIARSLAAGDGFGSPFHEKTGPTAWMPPILPALLASLLWAFDGDRDQVMLAVIFIQVHVLIGTGLLVVLLVRKTTPRVGTVFPAVVFLLALLLDFRLWFQHNHDCWLVLLSIDILIAWLCWFDPLGRWSTTPLWGLFGGICALINPIVALTWGVLSLPAARRSAAWSRLGVAVLVAGLTLAPWTMRNYWVFGCWIPVKSNLAFELYQSQCLPGDGLLQNTTFGAHPIMGANRERRAYKALGEIVYVEKKSELFWRAMQTDPIDFLDRVAGRFFGVTLWYVPLNRAELANPSWGLWITRLTYPLAFLALVFLVATSLWRPLGWAQWIVIGVYLLYLAPYIVISYYERYSLPVVGVKVLLIVWAVERLLAFLRPSLWHGLPRRSQPAQRR